MKTNSSFALAIGARHSVSILFAFFHWTFDSRVDNVYVAADANQPRFENNLNEDERLVSNECFVSKGGRN